VTGPGPRPPCCPLATYGLPAKGVSLLTEHSPNTNRGNPPLAASRELEAMTKPELGTKRLCADCGAKFCDLNHAPIACPKCGAVFEAVQVSSRGRAEAARPPVREVEPVVAETQEAQFVSLEDAEAEARGEKKPGGEPEAEDEVEPDDESLDDAAFIEESEEEATDVTGGDIEKEEGT
jgi:uncharacterized protein (TIGR02300 family)